MQLGVDALHTVLHRLRIGLRLNVVAFVPLQRRLIQASHAPRQRRALRLRHKQSRALPTVRGVRNEIVAAVREDQHREVGPRRAAHRIFAAEADEAVGGVAGGEENHRQQRQCEQHSFSHVGLSFSRASPPAVILSAAEREGSRISQLEILRRLRGSE
jgi:hypothetical protein